MLAALFFLASPLASFGARGSDLVEVRSSIDVPLAYVEVWDAARWTWTRHDARGGVVRVAAENAGSRMRAPGHPRQVAEGAGLGSGAWTLAPGASFEVVLADPACVRSIAVRRDDVNGELAVDEAAFGFVDERHWRVAVDPGRFDALEVRVEHAWDGSTSTATFLCAGGARGVWELECGPDPGTREVELVLVGPGHPRGRTTVELHGFPVSDGQDGSPYVRNEEHAWGRVVRSLPRIASLGERTLASDEDRARFTVSRAWEDLAVVVVSRETGAHALDAFPNLVGRREVKVEAGLVVRGRVVDPGDNPLTGEALVGWGRWTGEEGEASPPSVHLERVPLGKDGAFEIAGSPLGPLGRSRPGRYGARLLEDEIRRRHAVVDAFEADVPLVVRVRLPGYEPTDFTFECGDVATFDCGDLVLRRSDPDLVLLPRRRTVERAAVDAAPAVEELERVQVLGEVRSAWTVQHARLAEGGALELVVSRPRDGPTVESRFGATRGGPPPWPDEPRAVLVVGTQNAAYARDDDGDLRRVPAAEYDVEIETRRTVDSLKAEWRTLPLELERSRASATSVRLRFVGPADGVELRWGEDRRPLRPGAWRLEL